MLAKPGGDAPAFNNLDALKRAVVSQAKVHFCDICLKGRKVFISEQVGGTGGGGFAWQDWFQSLKRGGAVAPHATAACAWPRKVQQLSG